jgi:uncharacterized protein (TIGR00369 family)
MSRITIAEFEKILRAGAPFAAQLGVEVVELSRERAVFRLPYRGDFLRPGGTISGPMMMGLADLAMYGAVLAAVDPEELAVTTNLNINFLRKPGPADLIGEARLLKLGKRLAVGEVTIFSVGEPDILAHATGTYSIPPRGEEDVV